MAKKSDRASRESSLAAGWVVEADAHAKSSEVLEPTDGQSAQAQYRDSDTSDAIAENQVAPAPQLSHWVMLLLGVFGGLYLAYTWIWLSWSQYMSSVSASQLGITSGSLGATLQLILYGIAPLAPAIWFIAALITHRGGRGKRLGIWLFIGAIVLAPLPYLLAGIGATGGVFIGLFPLWSAI